MQIKSFSYEKFCAKTRLETEAKDNLIILLSGESICRCKTLGFFVEKGERGGSRYSSAWQLQTPHNRWMGNARVKKWKKCGRIPTLLHFTSLNLYSWVSWSSAAFQSWSRLSETNLPIKKNACKSKMVASKQKLVYSSDASLENFHYLIFIKIKMVEYFTSFWHCETVQKSFILDTCKMSHMCNESRFHKVKFSPKFCFK